MKRFLKIVALLALVMMIHACGGSGSAPGPSDNTPQPITPQPVVPQPSSEPPLSVSDQSLRRAFSCSADLSTISRSPVLLVPGTSLDPQANFAWNWMPALDKLGVPYCTIALPDNAMDDIQTSAEYVVYAVRQMYAASGRRVQILGYSQGGMVPRWALRYWPDIRPMVDDLIGLSASNHGTVLAAGACILGCAPAIWQQAPDSNFMTALNRDFETVAEVSYTSIYTYHDEVLVSPDIASSAASSALRDQGPNIVNVATQDICPSNLAEHLTVGTSDPVAYALAVDALTHEGPADPGRIRSDVCTQRLMPGVDPAAVTSDFAAMNLAITANSISAGKVAEEPGLKCYVNNSCSK